jgi:putative tryptophan/tyrosine transport system substrate-binding protein
MRRREFITLIGGAVAAWPLAARAQQTTARARIGVLASLPLPPLSRFARKMQELGYIEGQNLRLDYRFAEGHDERYPVLAAELVALPVDVIVTWGTPAVLAAKHITQAIPIVMGAIGEAVTTGAVSNLARPGGNITGFAAVNVQLEAKRLELLKELLPNLSRVGMLTNATNPLLDATLQTFRPAAETLGISLELFEVRGDKEEIDAALRRMDKSRPDAVFVAADTLLLSKRTEIVTAMANANLPAMYPFREYVEAGGLIVHAANLGDLFERAAGYVDRILKGAKPGDLPVQQATGFELVINLKTAKALGLDVPPTLLARADEVIE